MMGGLEGRLEKHDGVAVNAQWHSGILRTRAARV